MLPLMSTIPLLDLDRWFDGDAAERRALAAELDAHLCRLGFLVVVNHRIPPAIMRELRARARDFFHRPAEQKAAVAMSGRAYRGWVGPGLESNAATYGVATAPDLKETFAYGPVTVPDIELRVRYVSYAPSLWPDEVPGFQAAAEAWWLAARGLSDVLLELCALSLGLPAEHLVDRCRATTANVSINWYGPRGDTAPEPDQFRVGPHTDFGTLTVLDREPGAGGLQVLDERGDWIDAPHVAGSLLINTGDLLRRWTNDRWESNQHRVLPPQESAPEEELISLVFFHEPDHEAWIEALPTCVPAGEAPRYPGVHAHDYLAEKMAALAVR
jgi:isopenicillin N synthase-like dioxygenase